MLLLHRIVKQLEATHRTKIYNEDNTTSKIKYIVKLNGILWKFQCRRKDLRTFAQN